MPRLAERFTVIAPDLPGIGGSDIPKDGLDMTHAAIRIHDLVKGLGIERAVVVGHDIGLMVAYAYAAQFPSETDKLVLMDAFLPGVDGWEAIYNNPNTPQFSDPNQVSASNPTGAITTPAQSDRGSITGTIGDPSGAVVAAAKVEAKNVDNGSVYTAGSSATGNYVLPQLPTGNYQLTVTVTGHQWYWEYNYNAVPGLDYTSYMIPDDQLKPGQLRRFVDQVCTG